MARTVNRGAGSAAALSARRPPARWPGKTTTERVGGGTGHSRTVNRSASSGRLVTDATAMCNPGGTIQQQM